ncbi:MAG: PVC-type heme-binding CxxCH protein [Pirellulales bacterium]
MNTRILRTSGRFIIVVLSVLSWALSTTASAKAAEPRLRVLFLGDQGHHTPAKRAEQLIPVMDRVGIDVTYTEDLGQLNKQRLAEFDVLLVYANIDQIDDRPAQAILDYVAGGGGYVPVHCASYCFRNQPKLVELCGAQFQKHGTGDFSTHIETADHPITEGLLSFVTWDETYEHTLHNSRDRVVLQTRDEQAKSEPWTWVRSHGKGRVFYTAYGHDHRTWENPGFHGLIERGIRWAAGSDKVFDSIPKPKPITAPYEFTKDEGKGLPDYRHKAGSKETIHEIQKPLPPSDAVARVSVPRGFHAELFAAEPEIGKPLCTTWDERGRLWIAETIDYPNDLKPRGEGRDRIKICEDTDGDGRADKFTVFAEGLSIPTGLARVADGVVVHQAPETLFLRDLDGDDRCDRTEVLLTGWGTFDTHAGPSNLRYGHDNWLYTIVGYSGFKGTVGGRRHEFGQGIVRFKADGSDLRVHSQYEQQLMGPRVQRRRTPVRLNSQRMSQRLCSDR